MSKIQLNSRDVALHYKTECGERGISKTRANSSWELKPIVCSSSSAKTAPAFQVIEVTSKKEEWSKFPFFNIHWSQMLYNLAVHWGCTEIKDIFL